MTEMLPIRTQSQRAKLTARDFWLLADSGAFEGFVKTELIEGEIWVVNSVHSRHARMQSMLSFEFELALRKAQSKLIAYAAPSTELSADSVPEPDLLLANDVDTKAVDGGEVKLAIEISDTTLATDLGRKAQLYARHDVPEYWVFDVEGRVVHQHWMPGPNGYAERRKIAFGEPVTAKTVTGLIVATDALR